MATVCVEAFEGGVLEVRSYQDRGRDAWSIWRRDDDGTEEEVIRGFRDLEYAYRALREAVEGIRSILGPGGTGLGPSGTAVGSTEDQGELVAPKVDKETA